jgi:hypothetical protein
MLQEAFSALDEDGHGTLGPPELSIALSSLGYPQEAVDAAVEEGDYNQDGTLNFSKFVQLVARTEGICGASVGSGGNDAFPLTLLAKTRAISHLIDSYDTRHLHRKLQAGGSPFPDIRIGNLSRLNVSPPPRTLSKKTLSLPP